MNLHAIIIKLLLNSKYYSNYYNVVLTNSKSNKYMYKLLVVLNSLYTKYNKDSYTVDDLISHFTYSYPALQKDEAEYFDQFFASIKSANTDEEIAENLLKKYQQQQQAEEIALLAVQVAQGQKEFGDITTLVNAVKVPVVEDVEQLVNTSIKEINRVQASTPGLKWRSSTLNRSIGPLRKGNFGFLFARPETGKTTLLSSEVTFMGDQTDGNVLWVNNEQPGNDVVWRCYSSYLGQSSDWLRSNLDEAEERWLRGFGPRLKFIDNPGITKGQIESACKKYQPALIVFDQLDKVHGFDAERYDLLMKSKYQWARELSKQYGPVIGVCQAGGTGENKRYLEMNDIDSSMTAKQGEADWILGIGKVNDAGYERMRYFSICKNKLPGGDETEPALRHGKMEMLINEETARYEDKIRW